MRRITAALVLALGLLAGCSGESGSESRSIQDLGKAACGDEFQLSTQNEMFVQGQGTCGDVFIYTFEDNKARDSWLQAARTMGLSGTTKTGDTLVVNGPNAAEVEQVFAAVS